LEASPEFQMGRQQAQQQLRELARSSTSNRQAKRFGVP
jgi:hypothetical protein